MFSKAKILGHPIHPMLVGFPIAFYTSTLIAYIVYAAKGDAFWFRLGVVANIAGVVAAALAAIPGLIDWAFGIPNRHPAKTTGLEHMLLNFGALIFFAIDAIVQARQWDLPFPMYAAAIALSAIGLGFTVASGFLGWKMVQTHHVGVDLTGEQERIDPGHAARPGPTDHPVYRGT